MPEKTKITSLEKVIPFGGDKILAPLEEIKSVESLADWMAFYCDTKVAGGSPHTERAKWADLQKFLLFYTSQLGHDRVSYWTSSMSKSFQKHLQNTPRGEGVVKEGAAEKKKNGEWKRANQPLTATSINRIMATLRHFARWLHKQRPFVTGLPVEGTKDIMIEQPVWNGLTPREVTCLRIACDQRMAICTRANQNPLLEVAVFYTLLYTGLRESELASLKFGQYHSRGFHGVKRKGNNITRKVPVPQEARERIDAYLKSRGGELQPEAPLFLSRYGNALHPKDVYRIAERICNQANAQGDNIRLTPHMLRHTFLKRAADKYGVHTAQDMSGNVSINEIFRYTKPSQEEKDQLAENMF
ncbi:tyrosine-type recombinase/integrase [Rhodocytophaga aerolata]